MNSSSSVNEFFFFILDVVYIWNCEMHVWLIIR
jgi:hypothetical protein